MRSDVLAWLLEPENPSARVCTLVEILGFAPGHPRALEAQQAIAASAPVEGILDAQFPAGYWIQADLGTSPRYRATAWQVIFLAQLRAPATEPVLRACEYLFEHGQQPEGCFLAHRRPSGARLCLNGSLIRALLALGYGGDPRLGKAAAWLAARGERCGWRCAHNSGQPCAWGAIKGLGTLLRLPQYVGGPSVRTALAQGVDLLLRQPLLALEEPECYLGPRPRWRRLGAFLGDDSDVLEGLEVLHLAGYGGDPRLKPACAWLQQQADATGRWPLEIEAGKLWFDPGPVGQPSKWVTLRALQALQGQPGPTCGGQVG